VVQKQIPKTILKYKGIFDISTLYRFIAEWLINEGFEFQEKVYKHKPPEIELSWVARKKITGYVLYQINLEFHFYGIKDIEVIKDGIKRKMQDARVEITFSGKVETDYPDIYGERRWDKSAFTAKLKDIFEDYVIKKDIDFKHVDPLYYYILKFYEDVKKFLEMQAVGELS